MYLTTLGRFAVFAATGAAAAYNFAVARSQLWGLDSFFTRIVEHAVYLYVYVWYIVNRERKRDKLLEILRPLCTVLCALLYAFSLQYFSHYGCLFHDLKELFFSFFCLIWYEIYAIVYRWGCGFAHVREGIKSITRSIKYI